MGNSYSNNKNEENHCSKNTICDNYIHSLRLEKQKYYEFRAKAEITNNTSCGCFSFLYLSQSARNSRVSY